MRFASLGSGSKGNAFLIEAGDVRILLDCGFSARETEKRLARFSLDSGAIDAVMVSHEHRDHIAGVYRFCNLFEIPVYMTNGTFRAVSVEMPSSVTVHRIDSQAVFTVGNIEIQSFPISHDAQEPAQFVVSDGRCRLGFLTDAGVVTPHIAAVLSSCDALVLECNHDPEMLARSDYPESLKRRISGQFGHLSNGQAATLLRQIGTQRLQHVVAAHLSEQNNRPALALNALSAVLKSTKCLRDTQVGVACQKEGFDWREIL